VSAAPGTILVTGATDGLGRHVARDLAARGARVLLHGRNRAKAEAAAREAGGDVHVLLADLASLAEVRRLAEEVRAGFDRLDALVNNAGLGARPRREVSADGHELVFAVNHLAGFLLAHELLPLLRASAPARIVNVASVGQAPLDWDDVMLERGYSGRRAYAQSKLAQIMFTFSLAERLDPAEVTVNALHPATLMDTQMVRETFGRAMSSVEEGAEALERLILDPGLEGVTGRYFDGQRESRANAQAYDPEARARLWELSARLTGVEPG
jgi:NAD(P)-dependent dehydrogenase (short-subunit alcohol dehydrogenase family)